MPWNEGIKTFQAGEDLAAKRRVKVESGTVTTPPEVVYAGAGEVGIGVTEYAVSDGDKVAVKLFNHPGTYEIECIVDSAITYATVLYGAASGMVSDASSGSTVGSSLTLTAVDNEHIEVAWTNVLSTTAATVSVADSGGFTTTTTAEAALAEIYQHLLSAQNFIPIPLTSWVIGDATNTVSFGGPATDPILDMTNGDTDSALRWVWAAASVEELINQIPLPPDIDVASDLVLHLYTAKDADANTVTLASDSYFMVGDTKVSDVTATITQAAADTIITIAAADIPAGAQTVTVEISPSAHAGDALYLYSTWLEYTKVILTS
jgi:hypothetical protein